MVRSILALKELRFQSSTWKRAIMLPKKARKNETFKEVSTHVLQSKRVAHIKHKIIHEREKRLRALS